MKTLIILLSACGILLLSGCHKPLSPEELKASVEKIQKEHAASLTHVKVPVLSLGDNNGNQSIKGLTLSVEPLHTFKVAWYKKYHLGYNLGSKQDSSRRDSYRISVDWMKQKPQVWLKYLNFKFTVKNDCVSVYRSGDPIINVSVDGVEVPAFTPTNEKGKLDIYSAFTMKELKIVPGRSKQEVARLIPNTVFTKDSGTIEVGIYDLPTCDGAKRKSIVWKYNYTMGDVTLNPPYVPSSNVYIYQSQVRPFSGWGEFSSVPYVKSDGSLRSKIYFPEEPIKGKLLPPAYR